MKNRCLIVLFLTTTYGQYVLGQSNQILSTTTKPYVETFTNSTEITAIHIYEQVTVVSLRFTSWTNDTRISITSETYIKDCYNGNNTYKIGQFQDNELDKIYNLGPKGKEWNFTLVFPRIAPGIENIDLKIPFEGGSYEWKGIRISNPDIHPKTSWTEKKLKEEWDENGFSPIEGLYENINETKQMPKYKLAVKKVSDGYNVIYLTGADFSTWKTGDIKAYLTETATPTIFKVKWYMGNKAPNENLYMTFEHGSMKIIWTDKRMSDGEQLFLKLYPTSSFGSISRAGKTSGTGFGITSNGLLITNNHVVEGAKNIAVRGINGNFDKTYSATVLITDKNNDLAILRIEDPNFTNLGRIPFVIRTSVASVGANVFVMGYPLRSTMGDEIKLTNGIISSKTGFQGDVTSYQISAPVQPGNSGGPLFNENGELIGVINAKHGGAENASYAVKTSYLKNLIELLDYQPTLQTASMLTGKSLTQQVEIIKKYVYIIEVH
jgi:S1-C subfamily serine protease